MSANRSARSSWTERLVTATAALAAVTATATAQQTSPVETEIDAPPGWPEQPELAEGIAKQLKKTVDFGADTAGGASAFVKTQTGVLYVSWLATSEPVENPESAIRAALDQLRASIEGSEETAEVDYAEKRAGAAVEAKRVWRHVPNETVTMSRVFLWKSPDSKLRLVRGECVYAEADTDTVAPLCERALVSLNAVALETGAAGELGAVPGPGPAPGENDGPALDGGSSGPSIGPVDPDNRPRVLYEGDKDKSEGRSNMWLFIAGAVLIVVAFWLMIRGRRESSDAASDSGREGEEEE